MPNREIGAAKNREILSKIQFFEKSHQVFIPDLVKKIVKYFENLNYFYSGLSKKN